MKMENKELRQRLADDAALWQDLQHDLAALNSMPEGKGRRQQVSHTSVQGASGLAWGEGREAGARSCAYVGGSHDIYCVAMGGVFARGFTCQGICGYICVLGAPGGLWWIGGGMQSGEFGGRCCC